MLKLRVRLSAVIDACVVDWIAAYTYYVYVFTAYLDEIVYDFQCDIITLRVLRYSLSEYTLGNLEILINYLVIMMEMHSCNMFRLIIPTRTSHMSQLIQDGAEVYWGWNKSCSWTISLRIRLSGVVTWLNSPCTSRPYSIDTFLQNFTTLSKILTSSRA